MLLSGDALRKGVKELNWSPRKRVTFSDQLLAPSFSAGHYRVQLWIPSAEPVMRFDKANNFLLSTPSVGSLTDAESTDAQRRYSRDGRCSGRWRHYRALKLLGFAGAFRRSELVALDVGDCIFGKDGLTITLRRSRTERVGRSGSLWNESRDVPGTYGTGVDRGVGRRRRAAVPFDQSAWAGAAGRLSGCDVTRVLKKLADRAGLDSANYAGHSLRAGHATSAAIARASERSIMN